MVYHFVKQIEIDVEADSLGRAIDFVNNIDDCEEIISDPIMDVNDFADDIEDLKIHFAHTEYVGCTNRSTVRDETTAEKLLRDYLNSDDDEDDEDDEDDDEGDEGDEDDEDDDEGDEGDEDLDFAEDISPEALAGLILAGFLASIIDTRG